MVAKSKEHVHGKGCSHDHGGGGGSSKAKGKGGDDKGSKKRKIPSASSRDHGDDDDDRLSVGASSVAASERSVRHAGAAAGAEGGDKPARIRMRPARDLVGHIGNKLKRAEVYSRVKAAKKREKKDRRAEREKEREKLGDKAPPKEVPKTIENMRIRDETHVDEDDEEAAMDEVDDEFAAFFQGETPKTLITSCQKPTKKMFAFIRELLHLFPGSYYYARAKFSVKRMTNFAKQKKFTNVIIIGENRKQPNNMIITHLPDGPTTFFKISSLRLTKEISNHGVASKHKPELILNNFDTKLGHRLARMLQALFPQDAEFTGRRVVTFHNQRDFIFLRHHRYVFDSAKKARLQPLGPHFTLKVRSFQSGTFDSTRGEYEWLWQREMGIAKRKFQI